MQPLATMPDPPYVAVILTSQRVPGGDADHADAQRRGRVEWYGGYTVRVATVTHDYGGA